MLVLTRTIKEKLIINNKKIVITILDIKGSQVRLGIEAPKEISIYRDEIYQKIKKQKLNKKI